MLILQKCGVSSRNYSAITLILVLFVLQMSWDERTTFLSTLFIFLMLSNVCDSHPRSARFMSSTSVSGSASNKTIRRGNASDMQWGEKSLQIRVAPFLVTELLSHLMEKEGQSLFNV